MSAWASIVAGLLLGAIFGSFIATLCLRWPEGRSVLAGRSCCDGCGATIPARRLVPLLSASLTGFRAPCCGATIHPLHTRTEAAAALIGGLSLAISPSADGLALAVFGWLLLPLLILDIRHHWLPDRLTLLLALAGGALGRIVSGASLAERLLTGVAAGGALALVGFLYLRLRGREGLGGGDPKLFAAVGLWLGAELTVLTLLAAALLGLAEALLRGRSATDAQPFGAFLAIAAWAVAAGSMIRG